MDKKLLVEGLVLTLAIMSLVVGMMVVTSIIAKMTLGAVAVGIAAAYVYIKNMVNNYNSMN